MNPFTNFESSITSMKCFACSCVASQMGTIISAEKRMGPRIVIMMNDFFFTLERYSRWIMIMILLILFCDTNLCLFMNQKDLNLYIRPNHLIIAYRSTEKH